MKLSKKALIQGYPRDVYHPIRLHPGFNLGLHFRAIQKPLQHQGPQPWVPTTLCPENDSTGIRCYQKPQFVHVHCLQKNKVHLMSDLILTIPKDIKTHQLVSSCFINLINYSCNQMCPTAATARHGSFCAICSNNSGASGSGSSKSPRVEKSGSHRNYEEIR